MMHTRSTIRSKYLVAACALGAILGSPLAFAAGAGGQTNADIQAQYRVDVERCRTGQTNQDKATCMREAGAALEEARRNRLTNSNEAFDQNQRARCMALPVGERDDCMLQMTGQNTTVQGSVEAGGVLRETTITVPADSPGAAPGTMPGTTYGTQPAAPGLAPNPPAVVPAPSLTPTPGTSGTGVPGTSNMK